MKIKHSELDEFSKNPRSFLHREPITWKGPFAYSNALKFAINFLHKENDNILAAHEYLDNLCIKNFKNLKKIEETHNQLDEYFRSFMLLNHIAFSTKYRLNSYIHPKIIIGGELPRIDLKLDSIGYAAYIFVKDSKNWDNELRMPIIQFCLSEELNCSLNEVEVGVYDLNNYTHQSKCFSESDVRKAYEKINSLFNLISNDFAE